MRVAHINVEWNTGGPGTIAHDICEVSLKNGIECLAAYGRGEADLEYESFKIDTKVEVALHAGVSRILSN